MDADRLGIVALPVSRTGFEGGDDAAAAAAAKVAADKVIADKAAADKLAGEKNFSQVDIDAAIEKAVTGLKTTNTALKEEKTGIKKTLDAMQKQFEALGGEEGIKTLSEFQKKLSEDESTKLLSEGKHEEWFDRRTEALRKDHENQLTAIGEKLTAADETATKAVARFNKKVLEADVLSAAKDEETVPGAASDIQLRAERAFVWDDEKEIMVTKDDKGGVLFGKDGSSPKTVREWLVEQKENSRHWWPASKGAGADGSGDTGGDKGDEDMGKLPYDQFAKKRQAQKEAKAKERGFRPGAM